MSLKSRKRTEWRRGKSASEDALPLQRQTLKRALIDCLSAIVVLLTAAIVVIIMAFCDRDKLFWIPGIFLAEVLLFGIMLTHGVAFVRRLAVFRELGRIKELTEESVSVRCEKVSFLIHHESKFSSMILCVWLKDQSGNQFCYVCPEKWEADGRTQRRIREQYLGRTVDLACYRDTNMVKSLPLLEFLDGFSAKKDSA